MKIEDVENEKQIKDIEELAKTIWTEHYMPIIGPYQIDYMLNKYQSFEAISESLSNGYIYFIASIEGQACGYSAITFDNGIFLSKFYVEKSYRGKGIGKMLFNKIIEAAALHKQSRIWLTCNKYNSETIGIYKKMGFEIIDSIVTDIGNGFVMDDYVMEKNL
ncbi:MAG: GNAT family N-acetyltransferase, partial [Clostridia bacterium]|nr:GNAT family N-acetyltransferase [Clostridia bacterium]